ncbi:hypothetical protein ACFL1Z_09465, partial [Thermodesulfobacteriota bacterium]
PLTVSIELNKIALEPSSSTRSPCVPMSRTDELHPQHHGAAYLLTYRQLFPILKRQKRDFLSNILFGNVGERNDHTGCLKLIFYVIY